MIIFTLLPVVRDGWALLGPGSNLQTLEANLQARHERRLARKPGAHAGVSRAEKVFQEDRAAYLERPSERSQAFTERRLRTLGLPPERRDQRADHALVELAAGATGESSACAAAWPIESR